MSGRAGNHSRTYTNARFLVPVFYVTAACATARPAPPPPVLSPAVEVGDLLAQLPPPTPLVVPQNLPRYPDTPVRTGRCPGLPPGILVSEPVYAELHNNLAQAVRIRREAEVLLRLRVEERAAAEDLLAAQRDYQVSLEHELARATRWGWWRLGVGVAVGAGAMLAASWAAGRVRR